MLEVMGHVKIHMSLGGPWLEMVDAKSGLAARVIAARLPESPELYVRTLHSCATWELSCFALCLMVAIVGITAVILTWKSLPEPRRRWGWTWAGFGGLIAVLTAKSIMGHGRGFDGAEAVLAIVASGNTIVRSLISAFNIVVILACPFLVAGAAVALLHAPAANSVDAAKAEISKRINYLNLLLYLSAALLVAGTMEVWSFYSWPSAYLRSPESGWFVELGKTMSTTMGSFFSLVLASVYFPTLLQLRMSRGDEVVPEDGDFSHWVRPVVNIMVILAPLLAGIPIAEILKSSMGR